MYTSFIIAVLTAALFADAVPADAVSVQSTFRLKTISADKRFNNRCVVGFHSGAGFNDAILSNCTDQSDRFYTHGTQIASDMFGNIPATVFADNFADYNDWYPVAINNGYGGTQGFTYGKDGYKKPNGAGFLGCFFARANLPQLFHIAFPDRAQSIPCNCAHVKLVRG